MESLYYSKFDAGQAPQSEQEMGGLFICLAELERVKDQQKTEKSETKIDESLQFEYAPQGRRFVLVSIRLPEGGLIRRKTEPAPGRDGQEGGFRILKGFELPDGRLLPKEIRCNSDGSISLLEIDNENRKPDRRAEIRMSQKDFISFIKEFK